MSNNTTETSYTDVPTDEEMVIISKFLEAFLMLTHAHWYMDPQDAWAIFGDSELKEENGQMTVDMSSPHLLNDMEVFFELAVTILDAPNDHLFGRDWLMNSQACLNGLAPIDLLLTGAEGIRDLTIHIRNELLLNSLGQNTAGTISLH